MNDQSTSCTINKIIYYYLSYFCLSCKKAQKRNHLVPSSGSVRIFVNNLRIIENTFARLLSQRLNFFLSHSLTLNKSKTEILKKYGYGYITLTVSFNPVIYSKQRQISSVISSRQNYNVMRRVRANVGL